MYVDIALPLQGFSEGVPVENQPTATSGYMLNCRPRDTLQRRFRIGKRPGLKKIYSQQIGGAIGPIVAITSVTTVI